MFERLALTAFCLACLSGSALAQEPQTVIAGARKALGDVKSITYSGSAKDVAVQQCGANATQMVCQGMHDPMRAISNNERFFLNAFNTPRTLLNDRLATRPAKVKIETVAEKKVYTDGTRVVELYHVAPVPHSNGLLIAYFPKEKVLFQGDFSLPAAGQAANDHVKALVPVLEKLKLDFDRYINVHAPATPQTKADLWKAVGK